MNQLPTLAPVSFSELFPSGTAFAPKADLEQMHWMAYSQSQLDAITGFPLSVLGEMPLICHRNTLTPEIRAFYQAAGIRLNGEYLAFGSADEAIHLAKECHKRGLRLAYIHPPPDEISGDEFLVVPKDLYNWLNDKANIDQLCGERYLPRHRLFSAVELTEIPDYLPQQAVYVKVCHPGTTGGGVDVRFCPDQASRQAALQWLSKRPPGWSAIRVEEAVDIRESWCLNLGIAADGVRYLGAAAQLFSSPGKQSGSRIDPQNQPSTETIHLGMAIARQAKELGFNGVAGFDIGETEDGQAYVFDLNFRLAACTPQVLLHPSATRRIGGKISQSWAQATPGPLVPALQRLEKFARNGQFVPLRLYESTQTEGDISRINGMLIASTQADIDALAETLKEAMEGLTPAP